ncbi:MAG: heat-inducible transcriptional repressor HrcA [Pseudomonadota bacterium]
MSNFTESLEDLSERSREIFRVIVDSYLETGEPVGSRTISRNGVLSLSPATIRNVMSDLEELGLLEAPHTSAGRQPTELGLRLFVDGMMQIGDLSADERSQLEARMAVEGKELGTALEQVSSALAGLSQGAGLVLVPKQERQIKHLEFVPLSPGRALAVLVDTDGGVENRILDLPMGMPTSALEKASNFLNARLAGRSLEEARQQVETEIASRRAELDDLTKTVVEQGIAEWSGVPAGGPDQLIVRGRSQLLKDVKAIEDLERVRHLFDDLEAKENLIRILETAKNGEGVRVFIGSENNLFSLSGSSVIARPYMNAQEQVVGVIGVIGPTRMNYARILPMVDFTAQLLSRSLGSSS